MAWRPYSVSGFPSILWAIETFVHVSFRLKILEINARYSLSRLTLGVIVAMDLSICPWAKRPISMTALFPCLIFLLTGRCGFWFTGGAVYPCSAVWSCFCHLSI